MLGEKCLSECWNAVFVCGGDKVLLSARIVDVTNFIFISLERIFSKVDKLQAMINLI